MSISDYYPSGKHKQEIGHFANIVKIAKADGTISEAEEFLLAKAAKRLHITDIEFTKIFNNPENYPTNSPVSYDERIERLFRLTRMLLIDGEADAKEIMLLNKVAMSLHFSDENVQKVCNEAINLVSKNTDVDDFIAAIKKVNKS